MKKRLIISLAIALLLIATLAVPAIAATEDSRTASVTVNQYMSLTITDPGAAGINFGYVSGNTTDNAELAQGASGAVTLVVSSETNIPVYLQTRGNGDFTGPGTAIPLGNSHWNSSNTTAGYTAMTTTYATVGLLAAGGGSVDVWHWLTIPNNQQAGTYSTTFYYQVIAQ
jgi:hypothetical protein